MRSKHSHRVDFWEGQTQESRLAAAEQLCLADPLQARAIFRQGLERGRTVESAFGLTRLEDRSSIPLIQRVFWEQGGASNELFALLKALAALEAVDALCEIALDPYARQDMRQRTLELLTVFDTPTVRGLFLQELQASQLSRKERAIQYVGQRRVTEASALLQKMLQTQTYTALFEQLLMALVQIADLSTVRFLEQLLWSETEESTQLHLLRCFVASPHRRFLPLFESFAVSYHGADVLLVQEMFATFERLLAEQNREHMKPLVRDMECRLFVEP